MQIAKIHYIKTALGLSSIGKSEVLFSALFTAIFVLGYLLSAYQSIDTTLTWLDIPAYFFVALVIWVITLFCLVGLKQWSLRKSKTPKATILQRVSDRKLWLITSLGIFACYLPIILLCFSVLTPDSWTGIRQITGEVPLSNAHPIIFTAFVGVFVHVGLLLGSLEFGIFLFSLAQSMILAMIFARIIVWMRQENIGKRGITAALFFYAILPINAIAGIIMWKDILFAGFGLMFLLLLRQLYAEKDKFFTKKNIFYFLLFAFLFSTWRNNGFYAYVLFAVLAIIVNYKIFFRKKYILLLLSPIFLVIIYSGLSSLIAKPTTLAESMSVPLQQIARTVKYHGDTLSDEDKNTINEILPYEQLAIKYSPSLSDPVKSSFNTEVFEQDRVKYVKLWFKLFIDHTKTYLAATLYNTYGYVYPYYTSPTTTDILPDNASHLNAPEGYSDSAYDRESKLAVEQYQAGLTSVAPVVRNIGFYVCMVLLSMYIAIVKRKWELTGVFIVLFSLFLTTIMGPVNGEFRYLYLFVVALPLIIYSVFANNKPERLG